MRMEIKAIPPSLNKVLNMHFRAKTDLKANWRALIRTQVIPGTYPAAEGKRRVRVTLHHSRLYDDDNAAGACKVIFDALRAWKLIRDDSRKYLEQHIEQVKCPHRERKTVIEIEGV